jgi:hypothetical protein
MILTRFGPKLVKLRELTQNGERIVLSGHVIIS